MVKMVYTHLPVQRPWCLFLSYCHFPVGPPQVLDHPGTSLAADFLPPAGEKVGPRRSPPLWRSAGSPGPAEPLTQPGPGFSSLLLVLLSTVSRTRPLRNLQLYLHRIQFPFFFAVRSGREVTAPRSHSQCQAGLDWARQKRGGWGVGTSWEGREVGCWERERDRVKRPVRWTEWSQTETTVSWNSRARLQEILT